jgi:hypothetical protein
LLALVVIAGPVAATAMLLVVRRKHPRAVHPRADRVVAAACACAALVLVAAWPSATLRSWLGYVDPSDCTRTSRPPPEPPREGVVDIEALKAELRQQQLDTGPRTRIEAVGTRQLDQVTGPTSTGRTAERWNVGGTDLGHPFVLDGRMGLVFGDTFAVPAPSGPGWRSNVLAWVDDSSPDRLPVVAMHEAPTGQAGELLGSLKINGWEQTVIPTNSIAVGDDLVLHYMSIACWGDHGRWAVRRSGLAVSRDSGRTFRRVPTAEWPAGTGFAQVAFVPPRGGSDLVHVFGIPEGRTGAARLARVPADDLLDRSAWRYWDGEAWNPAVDAAVQVVSPPVGELSVAWNPHHQTWVMLYLDDVRGGIVMRTADQMTGPWSRAALVASSVSFPSLYAPFLLPGTGETEEIRFTMSRYDTYNVVLMGARLEPRPPTAQ